MTMLTPDDILVWKSILGRSRHQLETSQYELISSTYGSRKFVPVLFVDQGDNYPGVLIIQQ
jgi:hypothetical protein